MACLKMCFVITVQAGYSIHPQTKVGGVLCGSRSSNYGMLGKITTGYPSTPCCSPQVGPVNPFLIFLVTSIWSGTSGLKQEVLAKLFDCINMPFLTSLISMLAFRNDDSSFHQIIICHHYAYFELIHFFISSF